jgi:hypothetical protein
MRKRVLPTAFAGFVLLATPMVALAQPWAPGSEIVGHSIQVETNGVVNTIYFDAGGAARIVTPGGNSVPATWTAAPGRLCLQTGAAQECWPYTQAFQAGQQVTLTSNCGPSRWLPASTNQPLPPEGERG